MLCILNIQVDDEVFFLYFLSFYFESQLEMDWMFICNFDLIIDLDGILN